MHKRYPALIALSVILAGSGMAAAEEVSIWSSTNVQVTDDQPPVVTNEVRTNLGGVSLDAQLAPLQLEASLNAQEQAPAQADAQSAQEASPLSMGVAASDGGFQAYAGPDGASAGFDADATITPPVQVSSDGTVTPTVDAFIEDLAGQIAAGAAVQVQIQPEIQAQAPAPFQPQQSQMMFIYLNGLHEVPPTDTRATGLGQFMLLGNDLYYKIDVGDLTSPITDAHFHKAPQGVSGPVVRPIAFQGTHAEGVWTLSEQDKQDLLAGLLYVNVHTQTYPNGEIRGQMIDPLFMPAY